MSFYWLMFKLISELLVCLRIQAEFLGHFFRNGMLVFLFILFSFQCSVCRASLSATILE